jgi:hypothetical protein
MAALSLEPAVSYRLDVVAAGFHVLKPVLITTRAGEVRVVRVTLELDPKQLE